MKISTMVLAVLLTVATGTAIGAVLWGVAERDTIQVLREHSEILQKMVSAQEEWCTKASEMAERCEGTIRYALKELGVEDNNIRMVLSMVSARRASHRKSGENGIGGGP